MIFRYYPSGRKTGTDWTKWCGKKYVNQNNIRTLSGAEKTRLAIALLLLQNNNLLVLDKPTTYLDVLSQRVILEALKGYQGAILIVSHTEEFISELKPDKVLILPTNIYDVWKDEYLEQVSEI